MLGEHLLGLYEKALDPAGDWNARLEKAKMLGFDYMELSIDESDARLSRLDWSAGRIEALRHASQSAGVPFRSICLSAHRRFPFGSADAAIRDRAYEIMDKAIDLADALGVHVIQLAGYDVYYEPSTPESRRRFREGMRWAAGRASRKQIMLGMEVMDTPFLNSISKHMSYEHMLQSPWFKVYPDLGNLSAWPENDPAFEIAGGIGSIVAVHLKDTLAVADGFAGQFKGVPFGCGCVDFAGRFRQLEALGYRGPYLMEMWFDPRQQDIDSVARAKAWIEGQFRLAVEQP